jgi:hypothetical protein
VLFEYSPKNVKKTKAVAEELKEGARRKGKKKRDVSKKRANSNTPNKHQSSPFDSQTYRKTQLDERQLQLLCVVLVVLCFYA